VLQPAVFSLFLLSGIAVAFRSRAATVIVGILAGVTFCHSVVEPPAPERRARARRYRLVAGVLRSARRHHSRPSIPRGTDQPAPHPGAIAVYLLLGFAWGLAYKLVALIDPAACSFPAAALDLQSLLARLKYFSIMTLPTVG
jgi:hypothetical protein